MLNFVPTIFKKFVVFRFYSNLFVHIWPLSGARAAEFLDKDFPYRLYWALMLKELKVLNRRIIWNFSRNTLFDCTFFSYLQKRYSFIFGKTSEKSDWGFPAYLSSGTPSTHVLQV